MTPQPLSFPFSGVIDKNGNLSVSLTGFQAGVWASWTVNLQATTGLATVLAGNDAIVGPIPIHNQGATLGPVLTYGSQGASVTITNGNPGENVVGIAYGMSSADPQDLAGNTSQAYSSVGQSTSYDGQDLINQQNVTLTSDTTFPQVAVPGVDPATYDVRNFASVLLGLRLSSGGPLLITFRWYQNADGTRLVGQRSMVLDSVVATAVATIPNLGPFLNIVVNRLAGGQFTWNASLVTSQRIVTDIFGGNFTPYLVEAYAQLATQNSTLTLPFGTLYAGPVYYSFRNRSQSVGIVTFTINQMGSDGVYRSVGLVQNINLNSGGDLQGIAVLPAAPCQVAAATGTTVGSYTFDMLIYTTTTGSS